MERWHLEKTPASREWHLPGAFKGHRCQHVSTVKLMYKLRLLPEAVSSIVHQSFINCSSPVTSLDSAESQIHLEGEQFEVERKAPVSQCRICSLEGLWCVRAKLVLMKGFLCSYYVPITFAGDTRTSQIRFGWSKISSHVRVEAQAQQHPPASAKACFRKCSLATQSDLSDLRHL